MHIRDDGNPNQLLLTANATETKNKNCYISLRKNKKNFFEANFVYYI
jgi:6-phosphogluconolactonase (cycloisomerase 2 family)